MKFAHISDLHIGKKVGEFSMLEDQRYILKQITDIIARSDLCGVIIAGDIYDKSVPSAEAVALCDEFLTDLAKTGTKIFIISGNHDCPERIAFGSKIMETASIYVAPVFDGKLKKIRVEEGCEKADIYLMPFLRPVYVKRFYEDKIINNYNDAVNAVLADITPDKSAVNILVAHQFVTGAQKCDSEEISVGGIDNISSELFKNFDYVALGHIHGPQNIGRETVRYCGSPLKYSASETNHQKSITFIDIRNKDITVSCEKLTPLRDMRKLWGTYKYLTLRENYIYTNTEDYVYITLTDEEEIPDAIGKLRSLYPNIMKLDYDNSRTKQNQTLKLKDVEQKSAIQLFDEFYETQNNQKMSEEQTALITRLIQEVGL